MSGRGSALDVGRDRTNSRNDWITELSETLDKIRALVARGEVRISLHGYEELAGDSIHVFDIVEGLNAAIVVEDPTYLKGPCVLVLEQDRTSQPIHVVWGIPVG